jgi:hypothetical protein
MLPLVGAVLSGLAVSLVLMTIGYVFYVATMASIELVHVIVDIEANTHP